MVEVFVRNLRRKIDDPYPDKLIRTVRGVGYTLRADDVTDASVRPPTP